jgi:hypothetical protein
MQRGPGFGCGLAAERRAAARCGAAERPGTGAGHRRDPLRDPFRSALARRQRQPAEAGPAVRRRLLGKLAGDPVHRPLVALLAERLHDAAPHPARVHAAVFAAAPRSPSGITSLNSRGPGLPAGAPLLERAVPRSRTRRGGGAGPPRRPRRPHAAPRSAGHQSSAASVSQNISSYACSSRAARRARSGDSPAAKPSSTTATMRVSKPSGGVAKKSKKATASSGAP